MIRFFNNQMPHSTKLSRFIARVFGKKHVITAIELGKPVSITFYAFRGKYYITDEKLLNEQ